MLASGGCMNAGAGDEGVRRGAGRDGCKSRQPSRVAGRGVGPRVVARSGRSGKKVTSRNQAVAVGLSQARREGVKVPRKVARSSKKSSKASPTRNASR